MMNCILSALSDMIDCFPTSMKNLVSRKNNETRDKLAVHLIKNISLFSSHTELCAGALKVLSKIFLMKDKRSESWCLQINRIVDSISGFWAICRPIDAEHQQDTNLEEMYENYVFYKFLDPKEPITLPNAILMMRMLFTLLKLTLNQQRNEPHFLYGHLKIEELLLCLEGIISQQSLRPKASTTTYLGLTVHEFNIFLTHCKINALEVLKQSIHCLNLFDHLHWLKTCMENLLNSEDIMQSHNLLHETLDTLSH